MDAHGRGSTVEGGGEKKILVEITCKKEWMPVCSPNRTTPQHREQLKQPR